MLHFCASEIFSEKLRSQGYRGNRKLQKMAKKVRRTLTHKINDLNKNKSEKDEEGWFNNIPKLI